MNIVSNTFLISYTDTVICTGATAISNVSLRDEIKLFPNPVTNQLTLTGLNSLSTISVKNLLGVNIFSDKTSNNNWHLNMDALVPGIYFITVEQKTSTVTLRVVKK
ncbi:MAG: T9SS type A sorting domain-containing protein [Bacteroidetes bacterium]|nr:T9SS type A sorting domain-containing protein [Bacteroidota bacterium]